MHPTPLAYVLDRTTNDCDHTPNNRLTLNITRTNVSFKLLTSTRIICNIMYMHMRDRIHRELRYKN
jgi:hypothetical protein